MQNPQFGLKVKIPKDISKSNVPIIWSCSVQKFTPKNTKYSSNESILKISHHAKAIAHAKSSLCFKNKNAEKDVKIHCTNVLELFCAKNRFKKHEMF